MKTYMINVNMSDDYIENELVEGSLMQMNYNLEPGSVVFLYSVGASVMGVYAVANVESCQKIESSIFIGTAKIMRKENYPMLDGKDLGNLRIRSGGITEIKDENTQKVMFSLMDRTGIELHSRFYDLDTVAEELDTYPQTILGWYSYRKSHKDSMTLPPLPLYHTDYKTGKRYWHRDSLTMIGEFKKELSSVVTGSIITINSTKF